MKNETICIKSGIDKNDPDIMSKLDEYVKYLEDKDLPRECLIRELSKPNGRVYNPSIIEHRDTEIYVTDYAFMYKNNDIIGHLCFRMDFPWGFKIARRRFFEQEKYCKLPIKMYPTIIDYLDYRAEGKFSYEGILRLDEKIHTK